MHIYLFPLLMDFVNFMVILRVTDEAGRHDLSPLATASFMGMQSIVYMIGCALIGRLLTRRNAKAIVLISTVATLLVNLPACLVDEFWVLVVLMGLQGACAAGFWNSFQTFMRGEVPPGSLAMTIGRYNVAWSLGIGMGYLLGGWGKYLGGSVVLAMMSTGGCLAIFLLTLVHKQREFSQASADGHVEPSPEGARPVDGRYLLIGWALVLLANVTQQPLRTFIPQILAKQRLDPFVAGTILFCMLGIQALLSLCGGRMRRWLYRRTSLVISHVLLAAGLWALWACGNLYLTAFLMLGVGAVYSFIYFASVYYVSNDPRSSRNVGINEAMVGLGNIYGSFACAGLMQWQDNDWAFYPLSIGGVVVFLALELWWLGRKGKPTERVLASPAGMA